MTGRSVAEEGPASADPAEFRRLMARWATGVSVVTTRESNQDYGLTVNALLSVSLTPPTLLVSLTVDADSTPAIRESRKFVVNILRADQEALSVRFARTIPGPEKFLRLGHDRSDAGIPLLRETLASFECEVVQEIPLGDHVGFVGRVTSQRQGRPGLPLIFFGSRYGRVKEGGAIALE